MHALLALGAAPSGPPYAAPETLSHFRLEPGFRIELVAAEPDVQSPIAMDIDERGRWFVVEMPGYPLDTRPTGRIRLLEDTDGDGKPDRSTVFADNLVLPSGMMRWKRGVIVTSAPDVFYLEDTDGDGRADHREVLVTGLRGRTRSTGLTRRSSVSTAGSTWLMKALPARLSTRISLATWAAPDAAGLAGSRAGGRRAPECPLRPDTGELEALAGRSQYGEAFDPWGRYFGSNNSNHIRMEMLAARYLERNPDAPLSWGMADISDHGEAAKVFPDHRAADVRTAHRSRRVHLGVQRHALYRRHLRRRVSAKHVRRRAGAQPGAPRRDRAAGGRFRARRGSEGREFLASTDAWFRPVSFYVGPDGALYVIDYYRKRIEHPEWTATEFQKNPAEFALGADRGRIYRVVPDGAAVPDARVDLGDATTRPW